MTVQPDADDGIRARSVSYRKHPRVDQKKMDENKWDNLASQCLSHGEIMQARPQCLSQVLPSR